SSHARLNAANGGSLFKSSRAISTARMNNAPINRMSNPSSSRNLAYHGVVIVSPSGQKGAVFQRRDVLNGKQILAGFTFQRQGFLRAMALAPFPLSGTPDARRTRLRSPRSERQPAMGGCLPLYVPCRHAATLSRMFERHFPPWQADPGTLNPRPPCVPQHARTTRATPSAFRPGVCFIGFEVIICSSTQPKQGVIGMVVQCNECGRLQ